MTREELDIAIVEWAEARGLCQNSSPMAQFVKLMEEAGELASAIGKKKDLEEVKDAIGDMYVVMSIIAAQYGVDMAQCINMAYSSIKDRTGFMTPEGIFVKDE